MTRNTSDVLRDIDSFAPVEGDWRELESDVGMSEMNWNVITEIWCYPELWLVFFSRAQFVTLPTADLDERRREFFLAKAVGAKIIAD